MIINKVYIETRIIELAKEKNKKLLAESRLNKQLYKKKMFFPYWIKIILFSSYSPIYLLWKFYNLWKRNKTKTERSQLSSFSLDFITYCLSHEFNFDTGKYFENQDEDIKRFIDGRIKSFLTGFELSPFSADQKNVFELEKRIKKETKHKKGFYYINREQKTYYLPIPSFYAYVFDLHYGLKQLHNKAIDKIKGRDILDIGAAYGDAGILFLQYQPRKIYAYEPVSENFDLLLKTIQKNNCTEFIVPVKKAIGETISTMTITNNSYASTLISNFQNSDETEKIEITTIDHIAKDMNIGLIKIDVEGFEYFVVKGGLDTIKRDRPIILISVYHTGKDFFEICPMIQAHCPEYKFLYVDMAPHLLIVEKLIIAYPEIILN
jgi:FkbM family methyltransferase